VNEFTSGWEKDDLIIIAARPGMGKTLSAIFHAYHAALSGIPVAFVSLEMTKAKLTSRIVSNVCGVSSSDITKGRLAGNQKKLVYAKRGEIENLPIYYYENKNSWDINDIVLVMRNWKRKYGIGLIFFDYLQLITDRTIRDASDPVKVITSVQRKITNLKSTIEVPVIELSQLSRNNEGRGDKRPGLSDLKGSGQIEQDASIVIFLYRQDYYDANAAKQKGETFVPTNDLEYIFAKNRGGEISTLPLKADLALNRIWSPDEFPPAASMFTIF
jgi:replicative DNA helicase